MSFTLKQIRGEHGRDTDDRWNLRHLQHLMEGYRDRIRGHADDRPYSTGSARWYSYEQGREWAKADLVVGAERA